MLYLIPLIRMLNKKQRQIFIILFNDLSYELDELGYKGYEVDLVEELIDNHFGIIFESDKQLNSLTECILLHQNNLDKIVLTIGG